MQTTNIDKSVQPVNPWGVDFNRLWQRKGFILSVTLITVALGAISLFVFDDVYEVQTRLYITKGVDPTKGLQIETKEDRNFLGTQAEIIGSPLIIRQALKKAPITMPPSDDVDYMKFVMESLTISPVVNTNVLAIRFQGSIADESLSFVDALIESYEKHLRTNETSRSSEVVDLLTTREKQLRSELEALEEKHTTQRKNSPLIGAAADQIDAKTAALTVISESLAEARVQHLEVKNKLSALQNNTDGGPPIAQALMLAEVPSSSKSAGSEGAIQLASATFNGDESATNADPGGTYASLGATGMAGIGQQLRLAEMKYELANQRFGAKHARTRLASAEIKMTKQLRDEFFEAAISSLQMQKELVAEREEGLAKLYEQERANAKELDDYLAQEKILNDEIARTEGAYGAVFNQLTDIKLVDQALTSGQVSVSVTDLDGTNRRIEKIWPAPLLLFPACIALGLAFGTALVLIPDAARKAT